MEQNNNDNNEHAFYFLVRHYIDHKKKEAELFSILEEGLSQEQIFIVLDAISDLLRFLKDDVNSLKYHSVAEKLPIQKYHLQYFIDVLKEKLPYEDRTTFFLPDYQIAMKIEKIKRSIKVLTEA